MGLGYKDLANAADITTDRMRHLMSMPTDDWSPEIRKAVCRVCGLTVKTVVGVTEWE